METQQYETRYRGQKASASLTDEQLDGLFVLAATLTRRTATWRVCSRNCYTNTRTALIRAG